MAKLGIFTCNSVFASNTRCMSRQCHTHKAELPGRGVDFTAFPELGAVLLTHFITSYPLTSFCNVPKLAPSPLLGV